MPLLGFQYLSTTDFQIPAHMAEELNASSSQKEWISSPPSPPKELSIAPLAYPLVV